MHNRWVVIQTWTLLMIIMIMIVLFQVSWMDTHHSLEWLLLNGFVSTEKTTILTGPIAIHGPFIIRLPWTQATSIIKMLPCSIFVIIGKFCWLQTKWFILRANCCIRVFPKFMQQMNTEEINYFLITRGQPLMAVVSQQTLEMSRSLFCSILKRGPYMGNWNVHTSLTCWYKHTTRLMPLS